MTGEESLEGRESKKLDRQPLGHETKTAMGAGMPAMPVAQPRPLVCLYFFASRADTLLSGLSGLSAVSVSLRTPTSQFQLHCDFYGDHEARVSTEKE